ncbi:MAG: type IV toxin-antitoxin system AbiEi family antitoxin [Tannerella sp.]|nr:type IV toxin-antitoxin system AbiEi family antitoxin [Tannerella sp.]
MNIENTNKINRLLQDYYPGKLYFSGSLKQYGYSDQLLKQYRNSGWLSALSKGVMYRAGDKLLSFPALACYNRQMGKSFHVAAHSALELNGFNHYVPMGKPVLIVGHLKQQTVPDWMKKNDFDRVMKFFSTETFIKPQMSTFDAGGVELPVSSPEQAFLECLLLSPKQYAFMDLFYIMEQLTTLRPEILQDLLENTDNLKVKRLFLYMAEKAGHYWFNLLDTGKVDTGAAKHQLAKNGVYVPKYKITVPKELYGYE